MALRRLRSSPPVLLVLVGEELTLVALVVAALMVDIFSVAGCVASVDFRNTPAAVAAIGAIGSNDMPMGYRPPAVASLADRRLRCSEHFLPSGIPLGRTTGGVATLPCRPSSARSVELVSGGCSCCASLPWASSNRVAEPSLGPYARIHHGDRLDLPRLTFLLALRRYSASLPASLVLHGEELLERFLRLTLRSLVAAASLVEGLRLAGCVACVALRNFPAAAAAMGFGASGFTGTALGGRPRRRLPVGASLEGPAALSSAAAWRFARPTFGEPWLAPPVSSPWGGVSGP
ncbi:hypothetical protein MRX96_031757 [Rhipicephalus microplus]